MMLKNSCDLFPGASPSDFIGATTATLTSTLWKLDYAPSISTESRHSIRFWATMLENLRDASGHSFSPGFRLDYITRTASIYNTWWVEMRYRADMAEFNHAIDTLDNVTWLNNYKSLWLSQENTIHATSLFQNLLREWQHPTDSASAPVIILEDDPMRPQQTPLHIYVIWDAWSSLTQQERSKLVLSAYQQVAGIATAREVTVAMGLSKDEADRLKIQYEPIN